MNTPGLTLAEDRMCDDLKHDVNDWVYEGEQQEDLARIFADLSDLHNIPIDTVEHYFYEEYHAQM